MLLAGIQWMATAGAQALPHLTDNFDTPSYGAASFNASIAADQGGTLAATAYSVYAPSADWQAQHSNGSAMLLVGDAGYAARASLNQNYATLANASDLPVSFQMDAWVTDTSNNFCWASITIGNAQNLLCNDIGAKFAILPELGGGLQVLVNGSQQFLATRSGNNFRIVLSDTAGTGSAFNGKGSKAALYNGPALVGIYTLSQLTAADGYLSFAACPYNGSWNITRIDNLSIRVENPATPMKWLLWTGNANWPADKRSAIISAMDEAVGLYNSNGYFPKNLVANYNSGVRTAQAGYGGWMDFGNSFGTRVTLHEIAHTLGCGTHWNWNNKQSGGQWTGSETNRYAKLFDGPSATIGCDSAHFWPYGLNYDSEYSATNAVRHVKIVAAMRRDMGIVGASEDDGLSDDDQDGLPDDWEMFRFGNLSQTASANPDLDSYNNLQEYQYDTNPNVGNNLTWSGGDGDWSSTNWSPGPSGGPTSAYETATVNDGQVTINALTINSPISLNGGATLVTHADSNVGGNVFLNGNLSGSGTLTKTGNYSLILSGDNSGFNGTIQATQINIIVNTANAGGPAATWLLYPGANIFNESSRTGDRTIELGSLSGTGGTLGNCLGSGSGLVTFKIGAKGTDTMFSGDIRDTLWAAGTAAMQKVGAGTLTLAGVSTYSGGTTVDQGNLQLNANSGTCPVRGSLTVNAGASVTTTGDGTGLGWNNGAKVTALAINGGTVTSSGIIHVWNLGSNLTLAGGTLQSNSGTSSTSGSQLEWTGTAITSQASANSSVIAGRINFRPDSGTMHIIDVADGAAATDLLISAALTETSRSNLLKTGPGTLRITGAVQITGVINVESGTLDFAPSSVSPSLRISVSDGAHVNLSNAATAIVKNVYIAGQRLTAGTWGAPGSGAANQSPAFTGTGILQVTDTEISNRERWKRMKYGQFTHYVWDGGGYVTRMPDGSPTPSVDYVADNFDAAKYANDLQSTGVEYVIFTAWHANFHPLFNSTTFRRWTPWRTVPLRDMLGDMITAVRAKGIRVLFYTHPNQPAIFDYNTHNNQINDLYAELIDRYGDQIDGLYLDENDPGGNQNSFVDFVRLGQTIHRRNPDMMLIQNFYGNLYCNSVPMGESGPSSPNFSKDVSWPSISAYAQVMSNTWSAQVPVSQYAATRSPEGIFRGAVTAACSCTEGGGTAWAAGPFPGGQWEQGVLEAMQGAGQLMAPVAESIKNTYPSTSFPFSWSWGGATRSVDDTKEYIHVLWPPSGNTLTLPAPTDGKVFANARLLANGQPVTLAQNGRVVRLTLTGTNTWDPNDTVITMDVVSAGDPYLANNTTPDATYTGSWVYGANRATSEFGRDVHSTTVNGDFVEYHFNGTDLELVVSCGPNRGTMDIYIDGVFKQSVNATDPTDGLRKTIYRGSGLTRGNHTLKVVKTGGSFLAIDAFRATELIDSADPDVGYQAMTFFNNTDTTPNPIGYIEYDWQWSWQQRDRNEYNWDAHWASGNGSTFWIHFNGTGVQFVGTYDGVIDFYLDDVFVKQVNMRSIGGMARVVGIDIKGLPAGKHVLKGVKAGDTYALVDAFFVYNSQNSSWSTQSDGNASGGSYRRSPGFSDAATLRFHGTGLDVLAPHGTAGGTVAATLQSSAYQDYAWQVVNQYAAESRSQCLSFASRNVTILPEGDYTLALSHNRGFGSIALDALRVYKNRPGSGPALKWGASGGGGSGTWDVNTTANWWDGANATAWYDLGATDYSAIFGGGSGLVTLASNPNVNQLTFNTTGYTLQNGTINFNGFKPTVTLATNVAVTFASGLAGSSGLTKDGGGTLTLTGGNSGSGGLIISNGSLVAARSMQDNGIHTLGTGPLIINHGGTLRTTRNWATSSYWNSTSVGAITLNQGGTWSIEAVGMTVRNGLNLNGGSIVGTTTNTDWGALHLMSDVVADGNAVSSVGVDTALSGTRTFTVGSGAELNYSGILHSQYATTGALIKTGAGTMVLSGTNTYSGATTVNDGSLLVNGSTAAASAVTVASGATLGGTGTVRGSTTIQSGGTLAPGDSGAGTLTASSSVAVNGKLAIELNGASCDRLSVTGNLNITNATLDLTLLSGGVLQQEYTIASFGSRTGSKFASVTGLPTGYSIAYGATSIKVLPTLSSLTLSSGTLTPVFNSGTYTYAASVANSVSSLTVVPTLADTTASIKVNGSSVISGATSQSIPLSVGSNTISVVVTAQDGTTLSTYTITVTRAPSAISTLANLTLSNGTLAPVFNSGTNTYAASVANSVSSLTVAPTLTDTTASIKVNGSSVISGATSQSIPLSVGSNTISVVVTAQDGTTTSTYTITVTRAPSSVATLAGLSLSTGTLSPVFAPATTTYATSVANATSSITVTPTVTDATATVNVNGTSVTSGSASGPIALAVGSNTITVLATAQDGKTTKTYTITVTRISNVATLAGLSLSTGSLSPTFASATTTYATSVVNATNSITVTPTVTDATATVKVNGTSATSGSASDPIALAVGTNTITVLVTAQDGTTTITYTITVTRAPSNVSSFASWAAGEGLSDTTPGGDPDKDGLPNALEYVLGGDPTKASPGITPVATVSGSDIVFTFNRADSSETTDLTLQVEASTDLVNWNETCTIGADTASSSPGVAISENGASADTVTVTIPRSGAPAKFVRAHAIVTP